jgi:hypothetical protein
MAEGQKMCRKAAGSSGYSAEDTAETEEVKG